MNTSMTKSFLSLIALGCAASLALAEDPIILTPPASTAPRVNGPSVFGVRPGSPVLYHIPATGGQGLEYSVSNLPAGLSVDPASGLITGVLGTAGNYDMVIHVHGGSGDAERKFRIVAGDSIALTPAMGWNSWNCWAGSVDRDKVMRSARAMVSSGLSAHGWTYINIDDTWQGARTGEGRALQGNGKFPGMKTLCDSIHALGLKAGIYSTPWETSYAKFAGGSSDSADGAWSRNDADPTRGRRFGAYSFEGADARQWAAWGFDYLKYDWNPNDVPHVRAMSAALRSSGRDILFSLSNAAPFALADQWAGLANSWRTTGDIRDVWEELGTDRGYYGVSEIGFSQDKWASSAGPGHWNDPDMLVVGNVGWSANLHPTRLTGDEQYTHISMWCMLSAPLLLGCDLEKLDAFTLNLLTNDDVLAIDQDSLGRQARRTYTVGSVDVYIKELEDGSRAVGFFNRDSQPKQFSFSKLRQLGFAPKLHVRDLWREKDLPDIENSAKEDLSMTVPAHGVMLYKLTPID
jgi:alpha-galactosidase